MSIKRRSHKKGQRTSKSAINTTTVANYIKGLYVEHEDDDTDKAITAIKLITASWATVNGQRSNTYNDEFMTIDEASLSNILKHLGAESVTDVLFSAKDEVGNKIYLFAKDDSRNDKDVLATSYLKPQSDFYGVVVNGEKLAKDNEIAILTEAVCNWHNQGYNSKSKDGEFIVYDEQVTKKGIRCITATFQDEEGNEVTEKQPLYIRFHQVWTGRKDENGNKFKTVTNEDAVKAYNKEEVQYLIDEYMMDKKEAKEEALKWAFNKDTYLSPDELIAIYEAEEINHYPDFQQAIDNGVFSEVEEGEAQPTEERDWLAEIEEAKNAKEAQELAIESGYMTTTEAKKHTSKSKLALAFAKLV